MFDETESVKSDVSSLQRLRSSSVFVCFWSFVLLFGDLVDVAGRTGSSGFFDAGSFAMAEVDTWIAICLGITLVSAVGCVSSRECRQAVFMPLRCSCGALGMYLIAAFVSRSSPFSNLVGVWIRAGTTESTA